jgi:hypothetical protein
VLALSLAILISSFALADESSLVGHWQMNGDAQDSSAHANHGHGLHVNLTAVGRDGKAGAAGGFDGRNSRIEVANSESLQLGTKEFSIALWVNTAEKLNDVLGDLLSKFDPETRRGFNFSIQNYTGVTSSQSNYRNVHFGIDSGSEVSEWTDHGRLGEAVFVFGLAVHDGQLFAGTFEPGEAQAGHVYRYDGQTWTDCGTPDNCNSVSSLAVYQGKLYVGTGKYRKDGSALTDSKNFNLGGKVFRYEGDNHWAYCGTLPDVEAINGMVVFNDRLYASSMYKPAGFFRYEGGTEWTACATPDGNRVESLAVHNGAIFASGYDQAAIYRYDGDKWEHLGLLEGATQTYGFATHRGDLYVSEWPNAKVYRWGGDKHWISAGQLGQERETMPLMVYNGKMYGGTLPLAEVYRFDDPAWVNIGRLDFTPNVVYRRAWSMAVFQGRLFVGTLPSGHVHSIEIGRNVTYDHELPAGWVHLAAVRDTDHLRLHVNGTLVAKSTQFKAEKLDLSNDEPLQIGFGAHDHFNGKLSDVRMYDRALSIDEIEQLADE